MEIVLKVEGMHCDHCVQAVRKAVLEVSGVEKANVTLESGMVEAHGREISRQALMDAIEEIGFGVAD